MTAAPQTGTSQTATPSARATDYTHKQILVILLALALGLLLAALDQTIVATALTRISEDFHRADLYSWVITSYLLTATVTTPLYGKVSDLFGRKRIFQFAIVIFLLGSALSGLSQNMYQLIAFRAVQGLGSGGLFSLALAIVGDVIPPGRRGKYQGYFSIVFVSANIVGPLVGGALVDGPGWRWVFYINLPLGAIALFVINRVLKLDHVHRQAHIDWQGAVLFVTGVSLLLVVVSQAGITGTISGTSIALLVLGAALIAVFIGVELRSAEPVLPLRLFRNDVFRISMALSLVTGAVMFGALVLLPQYMQIARGTSPTSSGLHLFPLLGGTVVASITVGQLTSRGSGYKKFFLIGTGMLIVGTTLLSQIHVDTSFWILTLILFTVGASLGCFTQTTVVATQNAVKRSDIGVATSSVVFFRTMGGAVGAAVLGAIVVAQEKATTASEVAKATKNAIAEHGNNAASVALGQTIGKHHAFVNGMDRAFLWTIPVAVIAFVISLFLREVKLRTTNQPADMAEPTLEKAISS